VGAFPQERTLSRAEALQALASSDAATRAEAVVWIANRGAMADAGLLHERLRDESGLVRSYAEQGLWLLWTRSGDAATDRQMAHATELLGAGQLDQAVAILTQIIQKRPTFAEAWNRRATVYYVAGEYRKSIADCDEVLKRNPRHFGALSGLGQIHPPGAVRGSAALVPPRPRGQSQHDRRRDQHQAGRRAAEEKPDRDLEVEQQPVHRDAGQHRAQDAACQRGDRECGHDARQRRRGERHLQ